MAVCRKWDVLATVIGEVAEGDRLTITWHGETVVDVPPRTVAHEGPVYQRPLARPDTQDALNADTSAALPRPATGDELRATVLALLGSPQLCSRAFITEQYDRYVRGNTVLAEHADGGVLRIDEETQRGIAVSTDASGRYTQLDPYAGAQLALAEAYRNVAVTGATPVAVTNCLNFGSPEDPGVMWQFAQAVRGLADGCAALGIPVTGGNVSFYNQTGATPILPTPVVGVLGVIDDVRRRLPTGLGNEPGETLYVLGDTRDEFDGSIWAAGHRRAPRWAAARRRPGPGEAARRGAHRRLPRRSGLGRPRPQRGRPDSGRHRSGAGGGDRLPAGSSRRTSTRSSSCSRSRPAGSWRPSRGPRKAASWRCAQRAGFPRPESASPTTGRIRLRYKDFSLSRWRNCAAPQKGCCPGSSDDALLGRRLGVAPGAS